MPRYAKANLLRISQRRHTDLRPVAGQWRFFPNGGSEPDGPVFASLLEALAWPDLARRRLRYTPLDQPFRPILDTRTGRPGEIDLRAVRTLIYTAAATGIRGKIFEARRERQTKIMAAYGFSNWQFVYGSSCVPYCARHCADHARFCRENEPPLLVMEDDAEPDQVGTHLVPPIGADRLHIGGNRDGIELGRILATKARPDWRRYRGFVWRYADADWFWQAGMLAYHASLYLTRRVMDAIADYVPRRTGAIDASVAELDYRFNVASPRRVWWWQNDDHNGDCTSWFVPPELRPMHSQPYPA
jgi:hypothetical protein